MCLYLSLCLQVSVILSVCFYNPLPSICLSLLMSPSVVMCLSVLTVLCRCVTMCLCPSVCCLYVSGVLPRGSVSFLFLCLCWWMVMTTTIKTKMTNDHSMSAEIQDEKNSISHNWIPNSEKSPNLHSTASRQKRYSAGLWFPEKGKAIK